ncbi:hypothetical protein [Aliivibrio kagoshimensis]|uniref:hypothetical protein n=1 Tax=Aliivibrio kagoshimensis TaxID=2910230 RepID=UPI003D0C4A59
MLKIDLDFLGFDTFITITEWKRGLKAFTVHSDGYRKSIDGNVGFELDAIRESVGGEQWIRSIPVDYLQTAEPYGAKAIHMLMLAAQSKYCLELLQKRPNLLALICHFYPANNVAVKTIAKEGQRNSLTQLGLIGTTGALSFLDKVDAENFDNSGISLIVGALQSGQFRQLSHYDHVSIYELRLNKLIPELSQSTLGYWFNTAEPKAKLYTSFVNKFRAATKSGGTTQRHLLKQALNFPSFQALKNYCSNCKLKKQQLENIRLAELRVPIKQRIEKH